MVETVRLGDSFSSLAERLTNDGSRWAEIEQANQLWDPGTLLIDERVRPPPGMTLSVSVIAPTHDPHTAAITGRGAASPQGNVDRRGTKQALIPAQLYVFVIADEVNPFSGKVIRRVITNPKFASELARDLGRPIAIFPNPERFGFTTSNPNAVLSLGRHAQGMKPSPYMSASRTQPVGARRFAGLPFWIDEAKARAAGATFHETSEVVADLERILSKTKNPAGLVQLRSIIRLVQQDREVLIRGTIPPAAVKGAFAMGATRVLQGVQIVGFVMSAISLEHAAHASYVQRSARPLAAETMRQAGGWAGAWAGMRLGALGGAALGIETGPGALVVGAVGGIAGGLLGYYGFGWIADHTIEAR